MSTANKTDSAFYDESNPSSSNCLYSGPYSSSSANFFVPSLTTAKFCSFSPDSTVPPNSISVRTQIATLPFPNTALQRTVGTGSTTTKWGSGNALLNTSTSNTKSFGYRDLNLSTNPSPKYIDRFITLSTTTNSYKSLITSNDNWYIYPKFFTGFNNLFPQDTKEPTTIDVPFKSCLSIVTPTYASNSASTYKTPKKSTMQTISIENRNTVIIPVNLKMYLCATTNTASSCANNPYGFRITIRDTSTSSTLSTNTNNNNDNVYCIDNTTTQLPILASFLSGLTIVKGSSAIIPQQILLKPGQVIDITWNVFNVNRLKISFSINGGEILEHVQHTYMIPEQKKQDRNLRQIQLPFEEALHKAA
jgi:hypothetical protein